MIGYETRGTLSHAVRNEAVEAVHEFKEIEAWGMGAREEAKTSFRSEEWRGSSRQIGRSLALMGGDLSTRTGNQALPGLWALVLAYIRPLI